MNGTNLLRAMSHVDESYIQAAEDAKKPKNALLRYGSLAACAAAALAGAFLLRPPAVAEQPPAPIPDPAPGLTEPAVPDRLPPDEGTAEPAPRLIVDLNQVAVNEVSGNVPSAMLRSDFYLTHEEVEWTQEEIIAWYGRSDFTPAFVPDGLLPAQGNNSATVFTKDGEVVVDLLRLAFYAGYHEDGSPRGDETTAIPRGFSLNVSKNNTHPFRDWLHWNETVEASSIAGTDVIITHAVYPYGPYDDDHRPAGYYDWYSAEFELDGLKYEVDARRLTLEEVAAVTASIITGDTNFTVIGAETEEQPPADPCGYPAAQR